VLIRAPGWFPFPGKKRAEAAKDYLRAELIRLVAERRRSGERRNDLVRLLLEAVDPETGQTMSDRGLADNLLTFTTAGHETTALALTWTFYLLSLHPEIEKRLVREIENVTGGSALREEHIDKLTYARQVIQEAMRLYPPAPLVVRAPSRDVHFGDLTITKGTPTYIPIYAVHRHRTLWTDPDSFDPDRFTEIASASRHRYAYLPFGAGPRICIGMSFALVEAVVILATLVSATRLSLKPGYEPSLRMRITLRPKRGMPMTVKRR
jgi:cytochrome P450